MWPSPSYRVLRNTLTPFREILTRYEGERCIEGAVSVIVSGNRPLKQMAGEAERYAALDGRVEDLPRNLAHTLMPIISERWRRHFRWSGKGEISRREQDKLTELITQVKRGNRRLRFWGTPHRQQLWKHLLDTGVDLINTDHLVCLRDFLTDRKQ